MKFDKDFLWGVATSSAQIEGAVQEDGRTFSIWDSLVDKRIANGENCNVACDHYHHYVEDIAIMKKIGVKCYRFSISWSRIIPKNDGKVNKKGVEFYAKILNELKKNNIEPMITLFHWDLPMWVYKDGGYLSNSFADYFLDYVKIVVKEFSPFVKYWITFNEPQCFVGTGCYYGWHAPFIKVGDEKIGEITRNVMLAHGRAVKYLRENAALMPKIGFAPTASVHIPLNDTEEEIKKAYNKTFDISSGVIGAVWWSDPIVAGIIPNGIKFITEEDVKIIHQPLDFYAFNIYQPENSNEVKYQGMPRNSLNWIIEPKCLYWACKFYFRRYKLPILVSENGMPNLDYVYDDNKVHDPQRIYYIEKHLEQLKKAVEDNISVIGYLYWSFMDNFEWTFGYDPRFGLVYIDYETQQRILKDSAFFYKEVIKSNGEIIKY